MITLSPKETRFVDMHHSDWNLDWALQFPEWISSKNGVTMMWQRICPSWVQKGENGWAYEWRTSPEYIAEQMEHKQKDTAGNIVRHNFVIGLSLKAELVAGDDEIGMTLSLTNESDTPFTGVICDGGCFQAKNTDFKDQDEVKRSMVMIDGKLASMQDLHRTIAIRAGYEANLTEEAKQSQEKGHWFWGRSDASIDCPAIVGAVSGDGSRAVVVGYEDARSASQNADGHHCLHSKPFFGDIAPGKTVMRKGYILFGGDISEMAEKLRGRISVPVEG